MSVLLHGMWQRCLSPPCVDVCVVLSAAAAGLASTFSVTNDVNEVFFSPRNEHVLGGKLPVSSSGIFDDEGWLWKKVLGQPAPPMSTTLADALRRKLATTSTVIAVAPSGAGKSFGAWQLATSRWVDFLDAAPSREDSVFQRWKEAIMEEPGDASFLLKPGETADDVKRGSPEFNTRHALYHTWILLHALTTMRLQCKRPSDWLFVQRHRSHQVLAGYNAALAAFKELACPWKHGASPAQAYTRLLRAARFLPEIHMYLYTCRNYSTQGAARRRKRMPSDHHTFIAEGVTSG